MTVHMHEEDVWIIPEEMIVKCGNIDPIVQKSGHNRIHFFLEKHEVAHHRLRTVGPFGQRNPAAETEGRGRGYSLNCDFQVVARNINLENACFEVAFTVQRFQNFLIVARHVLRQSTEAEQRETQTSEEKHPAPLDETVHVMALLISKSHNPKDNQ